jgi:steroid 5-alpha reductase family enzyme
MVDMIRATRYAQQHVSLGTLATDAALGWIPVSLLMAILWVIQRRTGNAGIVDAGWAAAVGGLAVFDAAVGVGWPPRRMAIALTLGAWGARLAWHLFVDRVRGRPEDGRYADLRMHWAPRAEWRLFWFFQSQALAAVFFSVPALLAAANPKGGFAPIEVVAMVAPFAAPELFLRVVDVDLLRPVRGQRTLGSTRPPLPGGDALFAVARHRDSGDRGAGDPQPR